MSFSSSFQLLIWIILSLETKTLEEETDAAVIELLLTVEMMTGVLTTMFNPEMLTKERKSRMIGFYFKERKVEQILVSVNEFSANWVRIKTSSIFVTY